MTPQANALLSKALGLSEDDRGEVAARLFDSLDPEAEEDVEAAWSAEIQRRLDEMETGKVQPVPWPEARRRILEDAD